jgi:hypothetical protein
VDGIDIISNILSTPTSYPADESLTPVEGFAGNKPVGE